MREIALFVEDRAHKEVIGALVSRIAADHEIEVHLDWRSSTGGHGMVAQQLRSFLAEWDRHSGMGHGVGRPDLIVAATDANCQGYTRRANEIRPGSGPVETALAIPDPHIERWLLLDGAAVKRVLGRGCDAPDQKCARGRYKEMLVRVVQDAGVEPLFGGIEFAAEIVREMDLTEAARHDRSLGRFLGDLDGRFKAWR